jgi:hypothetical protein
MDCSQGYVAAPETGARALTSTDIILKVAGILTVKGMLTLAWLLVLD